MYIYKDDSLKEEAKILIEDIFKFRKEQCPELNILEAIKEYSFKNDIPLKEIGDTISEHNDIVKIIEEELTRCNYFKSGDITFDIEEW